ncbi:MAG: AsmA family protein [Candidatus Omnitrophica bacterium]|nr:AsmA family protein [Candidatus Omnitrophota bacterium]MDD5592757.1 AsmA family protein [Candidatus Omnitrophota bacterium]
MKILRRLIISLGIVFIALVILLIAVFSIVKHLRIKEIVESKIEETLGIKVTIDKIEFSPLLTHIAVKGITVHNPAGFPQEELAYLDYIHLVFDPWEVLIRKKPDIYLFAMDLKQLNIVKNKGGKINIDGIVSPKKEDAGDEPDFYFDIVVLSIGDVKYTDYTAKPPKEYKYHIGIKNTAFVGLKDENAVVKMAIYKAIENTEIGKLLDLTFVQLLSQIKGTADAAWGTAKTGARDAWGIATLPFKLLFSKD